MKYKYLHNAKGEKRIGDGKKGRPVDPSKWITGPDEITREKYYAFLKHRNQARFRKEDYELDWDDWQKLWPHEKFLRRGRGKKDLCISRVDIEAPWSFDNCIVTERFNHLKRAKEFRNRG